MLIENSLQLPIFITDIFFSGSMSVTNESHSIQEKKCFYGNGQNYTGNTSVTISGKQCVQWNKIPYLNKYNFPNLKDNHCRNPQSYCTKPWCYVSIKYRIWDYCKMKDCINVNAAGNGKKSYCE